MMKIKNFRIKNYGGGFAALKMRYFAFVQNSLRQLRRTKDISNCLATAFVILLSVMQKRFHVVDVFLLYP